MTQNDFQKYVPVLNQKPFSLYPAPEVAPSQAAEWYERKFTYVTDSETHVTIKDAASQKIYQIPLVLIEFANPGLLRLTRQVKPYNGDFV